MCLIVVLVPVVIVVIAVFNILLFVFVAGFVIAAFRVITAFGFWGQPALALGLTLSR